MHLTGVLLVAVVATTVAAHALRPRVLEGDDVFVTIENGALRGVVATSINGTLYNRFVGIPFAEPPLGDLRFRVPQPAANWTGVREALSHGSACSQMSTGSEDCLYLNVYVPVSEAEDPTGLPVMVNIYGGGFRTGASTYRAPDYFVDKDVVLVTFNYRLGSIGFLSLQNDDIPGNTGLKDQVLALQWVQRNIAAFGGDPSRVTIFGESAGGISTSFLFLSPAAKGLFSGVIPESGEFTSVFSVVANPRERAYRFAAALGFQPQGDEEDDARLAAFLRAASATDLTRDDSLALSAFENRGLGTMPFAPTVEPASDNAVISEPPATILAEGRYNHVPVMTGVTSGEGDVIATGSDFFVDEAAVADMRENFTLLVGPLLPFPTEEERTEAAKEVEFFYFGDDGFSLDNLQGVIDMCSDIYFIQPADVLARAVVNTSNVPVYFYYFDYDGWGHRDYGMTHAATPQYLFMKRFFGPDKDPNSNDGKVTELLTTLWTNFAKYGEPAPSDSPVKWEKFTADSANYLDMKREFVSRQDMLKERMDFWRELLPSYV